MNRLERKVIELQKSDLTKITIDQIVSMIMPLTKDMIINTVILPVEIRMYRARVNENAEFVNDLREPPASIAKEGRVNRAGHPMFYSSLHRFSAIAETLQGKESQILVSCWKTIQPLTFTHIAYDPSSLRLIGTKNTHIKRIKGNSLLYRPETSRKKLSVMARLFVGTNHKDKYKLSTAISECMLKGPFDGLVYPSISMAGGADNFAIHPEIARKKLQFIGVEKVRINTNMEEASLNYATSNNEESLDWKGRPPTFMWNEKELLWTEYNDPMRPKELGPQLVATRGIEKLTASIENQMWIVKDSKGNVVDPE